jgi:hypothetical protein
MMWNVEEIYKTILIVTIILFKIIIKEVGFMFIYFIEHINAIYKPRCSLYYNVAY